MSNIEVRSEQPISIEQAREHVIDYEARTAETEAALSEFEAENGERLEQIRTEFEDYQEHPLYQEYVSRAEAIHQPGIDYNKQRRENRNELGWRGDILYPNFSESLFADKIKREDPGQSDLPPTAAEFDRRAAIAEGIGLVAATLHSHQGEPIISIAGYQGRLDVNRRYDSKTRRKLPSSGKYALGSIGPISKTRAIVGSIDQEDSEPVLARPRYEKGESDPEPRITMTDNVAGIISAYSLPESKRQLKQKTSPPYCKKKGFWSEEKKRKELPVGNSSPGDFSPSQLRGHDLLVIDGPHQTASDYEYPENTIVHRPKQKIDAEKQSRDQEVAVSKAKDAQQHAYKTRVTDGDSEIVLPTRRHDSIWLVGSKAIEAHLADAIDEMTAPSSKERGTDQAILRAAYDLAELVASGADAQISR